MLGKDFAIFNARQKGRPVFFAGPHVSLEPFDGFELVALPSGEVLDAVPAPVTPAQSKELEAVFLAAFA